MTQRAMRRLMERFAPETHEISEVSSVPRDERWENFISLSRYHGSLDCDRLFQRVSWICFGERHLFVSNGCRGMPIRAYLRTIHELIREIKRLSLHLPEIPMRASLKQLRASARAPSEELESVDCKMSTGCWNDLRKTTIQWVWKDINRRLSYIPLQTRLSEFKHAQRRAHKMRMAVMKLDSVNVIRRDV
jgi:hypothetical protein